MIGILSLLLHAIFMFLKTSLLLETAHITIGTGFYHVLTDLEVVYGLPPGHNPKGHAPDTSWIHLLQRISHNYI
jgi:hypothetical protein